MQKNCKVCGKSFEGNIRSVTCSTECRNINNKNLCDEWKRLHPYIPKQKICKICGKTFEITRFRNNACTCSEECGVINHKNWLKVHPQRSSTKLKECMVCKKVFRPKGSHVTCSKECSKIYAKDNNRTWCGKHPEKRNEIVKRYREKHKEKYNQAGRARGAFKTLKELSCCIVCFETNPFMLENHHPFGDDDEFTVCLCGKHHNLNHVSRTRKTPTIFEFFMDD